MVMHVVLYQPRPDLTVAEREQFESALTAAIRDIPTIRRVTLGKRIRLGTAYDAMMTTDYAYAAIFEFEDDGGLRAYLEHAAHQRLGTLFYSCSAAALAYDYEIAAPR